MRNPTLDKLLGTNDRDPGCEAAFEVLDQYVEARRHNAAVELRYPDLVAHLRNCDACREDAEGLLAAVEDLEHAPPAKAPR